LSIEIRGGMKRAEDAEKIGSVPDLGQTAFEREFQ
jgi:hypothetical protein